MAHAPKLLYEFPADSKTVYLQMNGERYQILRFLRTDKAGVKKRFAGGEIYSGDIAIIEKSGKPVEVTLKITSIITELPVDPPPPKKSQLRRRA
ncbi:MAG: hypothetical protein IPJ68_02380 [Candidatus Moraniibacteriota bacterium]|nr:MAG: hypothetical protein IPJ68_02380 [Candidatus Moranbacteria bacterium]